eukprot:scaffold66518_cov52-Phaeocystis_antarctica.AAC.4
MIEKGRDSSCSVSYSSSLSGWLLPWCWRNLIPKPKSVAVRLPSSGASHSPFVTLNSAFSDSSLPDAPIAQSMALLCLRTSSGCFRRPALYMSEGLDVKPPTAIAAHV